jgi:hypothetical protein
MEIRDGRRAFDDESGSTTKMRLSGRDEWRGGEWGGELLMMYIQV